MRGLVWMRNEMVALAVGLASCQAHVAEMSPQPAGASGSVARGDFVSFYERAAARTAAGGGRERDLNRHRALARYRIECSTKVSSGNRAYFTLARTDDGRAVLFVWTDDGPVRDLQRAVRVGTYSALVDPVPPDRQPGSLDWGWIYDRNGDGWVDYFTYLDGANPVMTDDIAHLVPRKPGVKPGDPVKIAGLEELELVMDKVELVFTHHADDDFDGRSDAVVAALRHPENPIWFYGSGVLRSRELTQVVDEDWRFVSDIRVKAGAVPRQNGQLQISFFRPGERALEVSSRYLAAINDGIRACRIPSGTLPRE